MIPISYRKTFDGYRRKEEMQLNDYISVHFTIMYMGGWRIYESLRGCQLFLLVACRWSILQNNINACRTKTLLSKLQETSWALVIWQSLLGRGSKEVLLRMWWLEGRMRAVRALFTHSPSTPPILTSEFVMADLLALRWECVVEEELLVFLWRLQRNEPGWLVGEHIHVEFLGRA